MNFFQRLMLPLAISLFQKELACMEAIEELQERAGLKEISRHVYNNLYEKEGSLTGTSRLLMSLKKQGIITSERQPPKPKDNGKFTRSWTLYKFTDQGRRLFRHIKTLDELPSSWEGIQIPA